MLIVAALVVVAVVLIALAVLVSHSHKKNAADAQNANVSEDVKGTEADETSGGKESPQGKSGAKGSSQAKSAQKPNDKKGAASKSSSQEKSSAKNKTGAKNKTKESPKAKKGEIKPDSSATSALKEEAPSKSDVETPEPKASRGVRLKEKLSKSSNPFGRVLFNILAKDQLSESDWEDVEDTLLLADVGSEASEKLVDELRNDARITGTSDPKVVREALRSKLIDLVNSQPDRALNANKPDAKKPSVIIMVGVNGTGKTTTAGKLARLFVSEGKSVMLAAADTFRAAAADQLETWGQKVGVPVVRSEKEGGDPASVAFDASKQAKEQNVDVLIIDTAGRLQNKANLMDELGKIRRVTEKNLPVDEVLLVLDAVTGQNGMAQAKVFAEAIGITGVVLSKLDGSAKGGIVISVQQELGVPVKLVGLGEGPDDLAPFDPEGFVDGILA
ncbi:signal recognition particle-docking protein FtsY [Bifidobacterium sp. ESL0769]|uniref:signal recognition particle-docking protein FtsY n=1 Tax=Bifidobacterium sp. ESL0769 TaxID=2983229 RepID=UPI0023F75402|nr:signal recognition particle-docking protein FtsY [Bifidobacterium sp. ESL0769]WEV68457.1 signal recognition particle-docking protein FtsY [Bifidobacterium sp. ESL0769]